jgi:hypothetical protein
MNGPLTDKVQELGARRLGECSSVDLAELTPVSTLCGECNKAIETYRKNCRNLKTAEEKIVLVDDFHGGDESAIHTAAIAGCSICAKLSTWLRRGPSSDSPPPDSQHITGSTSGFLVSASRFPLNESETSIAFGLEPGFRSFIVSLHFRLLNFGAGFLVTYNKLGQNEPPFDKNFSTGSNVSLALAKTLASIVSSSPFAMFDGPRL